MTRKRPEVEAAIKELRARTVCARCGRQPIDWHAEHHVGRSGQRISNMVGAGYKLGAVLAEIARCEPLCRSCHMREDGRAAALAVAHRAKPPPRRKVPQPCTSCGRICMREQAGLCMSCYMREWRRLNPTYMREYRQRRKSAAAE
jgi:hypothetical protein